MAMEYPFHSHGGHQLRCARCASVVLAGCFTPVSPLYPLAHCIFVYFPRPKGAGARRRGGRRSGGGGGGGWGGGRGAGRFPGLRLRLGRHGTDLNPESGYVVDIYHKFTYRFTPFTRVCKLWQESKSSEFSDSKSESYTLYDAQRAAAPDSAPLSRLTRAHQTNPPPRHGRSQQGAQHSASRGRHRSVTLTVTL